MAPFTNPSLKTLLCAISLLAMTLCAALAQAPINARDVEAKLSENPEKRVYIKSINPYTGGTVNNDRTSGRSYAKGAVVISDSSGAEVKYPLVELPVLFTKNTDELLNAQSDANVSEMAEILKRLHSEDKNRTFAVEGHASKDGDETRNEELSKLRAVKIRQLLLARGVPNGAIGSTDGFGSKYAAAKASDSEEQRKEDRRVDVRREK